MSWSSQSIMSFVVLFFFEVSLDFSLPTFVDVVGTCFIISDTSLIKLSFILCIYLIFEISSLILTCPS